MFFFFSNAFLVSLPGAATEKEDPALFEVLSRNVGSREQSPVKDLKGNSSQVFEYESHLIESLSEVDTNRNSVVDIDELPPAEDELAKNSQVESETSPKTVIEVEPAAPKILQSVEVQLEPHNIGIATIILDSESEVNERQDSIEIDLESPALVNQLIKTNKHFETNYEKVVDENFNSEAEVTADKKPEVINNRGPEPVVKVKKGIKEEVEAFKEQEIRVIEGEREVKASGIKEKVEENKKEKIEVEELPNPNKEQSAQKVEPQELQVEGQEKEEEAEEQSIQKVETLEIQVGGEEKVEAAKEQSIQEVKPIDHRLEDEAKVETKEPSIQKVEPLDLQVDEKVEQTNKEEKSVNWQEVKTSEEEKVLEFPKEQIVVSPQLKAEDELSQVEEGSAHTVKESAVKKVDDLNSNPQEHLSIDFNGLPLPSTPLEEEEKKRFLDSIPHLENNSDSIAVSKNAKKEYYQSLRKYLIHEEENKPPVPLQTYRWEDLRRAKERVSFFMKFIILCN